MSLFKRIVFILIALPCIAVLSVAIYGYFNWTKLVDRLKPELESSLSEVFESNVKLDKLKIKLFPYPALEADQISLDSTDAYNVNISRVYFQIALVPLLDKKIIVRELIVDSPEINFTLLKGQNQTAENSETNSIESGTENKQYDFSLQKIKLINGKLNLKKDDKLFVFENLSIAANFQKNAESAELIQAEINSLLNSMPFMLKAERIEITSQDSYKLENSELLLDEIKINASGEYDLPQETGKISLNIENLDLNRLPTFLARFGIKTGVLPDGKMTASVNAEKTNTQTEVNANSALIDLKDKKGNFLIKKADIKNTNCIITGETQFNCNSNLELSGLKIKDSAENYELANLKSDLNFIKDPNKTLLTGNADLVDFAFNDGATFINKLRGSLNKISVNIAKNGDVIFKTQLKASQMELKSDEFSIGKSGDVSAPLEVSIPAKGGYTVKGPVNIKNSYMKYANYNFDQTSGLVDVFVSNKGQRYHANNVSCKSEGLQLGMNADFLLSSTEYNLNNANFKLGSGKVNINAAYGRKTNDLAKVKLSGQKIQPAVLTKILGEENGKKILYDIENINLDLQADKKNLKKSVQGSGDIALKSSEVAINRKTIFERILGAISEIPIVGIDLSSDIVAEEKFERRIEGKFQAKEGNLNFSEIKLTQLSTFNANGKGRLGLDGTLNFDVDVIFLEETFSSLGAGFTRLSKLLGRAGRVVIPLNISGTFDDVSVKPDITELVKNNSGIRLVGSAVGVVEDMGSAIGNFITSPFRRSEVQESGNDNAN